MLTEYKGVCLSVNRAQSVRLEKETNEFKKYFKQIPVRFYVYTDFGCNLEIVESYEGSYSKKYQDHITCSFAYKLVCVDDKFSKAIVVFRGENAAYKFIEAIKDYQYCKKVTNKHFNKNLIMSEEEEQFQSRNICWIRIKLIDDDVKKDRDHCQITSKFRGVAHWSCNINLQLTKNVLVIFHNLRDYNSHLIFRELNKFDVKIDVIPNGLEKYMAFFLNKNFVFIDSMQFMNFSLENLVKNLTDNDFKYLSEESGSKNLELLKQKVPILMSPWTVFKDLMKKNFPIKNVFTDQ